MISDEQRESGLPISNLTSMWSSWFEDVRHLTTLETPPVYPVLQSKLDWLPLHVLLDNAALPLTGINRFVASSLGPDWHLNIKGSILLLVNPQMSSTDPRPGWQRKGNICSSLMLNYLEQTLPSGATSPNRPTDD